MLLLGTRRRIHCAIIHRSGAPISLLIWIHRQQLSAALFHTHYVLGNNYTERYVRNHFTDTEEIDCGDVTGNGVTTKMCILIVIFEVKEYHMELSNVQR